MDRRLSPRLPIRARSLAFLTRKRSAKIMRLLPLLVSIMLAVSGCASSTAYSYAKWRKGTAQELGVSPKEIDELAQLAIAGGKQVVIGMMKKADGVIEVYLGDHSGAGNGPIIEFSKVDGRWLKLDKGEIGIWMM